MSERAQKWLFRLTIGAWITFGVWALLMGNAAADPPPPKEFILFAGDTDSTEQASPWIPVRGANRIEIRTWSTHLAFGASNADSAKTDSIAVFKVGFSDSVTGTTGYFPIARDSVVITTATVSNTDTTTLSLAVFHPPLHEQLRHANNGSGTMTFVLPLLPGGVSVWGDGTIAKQYMRVYVTPTRRLTANTSTCDDACGNRTNGLRGLKMVARVYSRYH